MHGLSKVNGLDIREVAEATSEDTMFVFHLVSTNMKQTLRELTVHRHIQSAHSMRVLVFPHVATRRSQPMCGHRIAQ